jgi:hypothetical protein
MTCKHEFLDDICIYCSQHKMSVLVDQCLHEIDRLRSVIEAEAEKWQAHHSDPEKKAYWKAFARKVHP